jgi:hypothetical protein
MSFLPYILNSDKMASLNTMVSKYKYDSKKKTKTKTKQNKTNKIQKIYVKQHEYYLKNIIYIKSKLNTVTLYKKGTKKYNKNALKTQ